MNGSTDTIARDITAEQLVRFYQLQPHPEGGYFKETYRAKTLFEPEDFDGQRNYSTAIYFLLEGLQFSGFHKIKSDELWHFYAGEALDIYVIEPGGNLYVIKLGSDILNGETMQAVVPAECWFASKPAKPGTFSFVGCTVSPGFDFNDFELAHAEDLVKEFPQHESIIRSLCRQ